MPPKSKSKPKDRKVLYWHRTDLRLHDSPALSHALSLSPQTFIPIWTWDPHYVYGARVGPNRFQFLLDSQSALSASYTALNSSQKLWVFREAPQTVIPKLVKELGVTDVVFEKDTDAYGKGRDEEVRGKIEGLGLGVQVSAIHGRTLYDADVLVEKNGGKPTMSMAQVQHAGEKIGEVERPFEAPKNVPDPGDVEVRFKQEKPEMGGVDFNAHARESGEEKSYVDIAGPGGDFGVPTLEELGMGGLAGTPHRGGEEVALKMLEEVVKNETYTATFEKPKTAPTDFEPQATTLLSPHLHFGTLGIRRFYWAVRDVVDSYKGTASQPPTSLTGQLLFRDMYFGAQAGLGWKFAQTYGNKNCRFIPWHLPSKVDTETGLITGEYTVDSKEAEVWFNRWKNGVTGFPFVDALMRQLKLEGWIHHLGRHMVACFLTRGGCYVDWERGAEVFEEWLIDHETACNVGNWQWLSCTAFYAQFYRCYSPIAFGKKWDKEGNFIRRYVPELKDFDAKYIYEPWKAPIADQKSWGCLVKGDGSTEEEGKLKMYPKPMFDFAERREICIQAMKNAYEVGLYGDNEKVLNGTWRALFSDNAEGPTEGKKGPPGAMVEHEDADGAEEVDHQSPKSPKKEKKPDTKGKGGVKGHKRDASQGTLDGMVTRKKKKEE